ncbi:hypothetical protein ACFHWW_26565 [Ensifer sp. P24N7]|uniref:hypothetical protein n=1 Tax=Sinorhizobium sp. P24N7 TaxID=3348358 RepID=UPI0035F27AEF
MVQRRESQQPLEKTGEAHWIAIIFWAFLLGPLVGAVILMLPLKDWRVEQFVGSIFMAYIFGSIPAVFGGIVYSVLRRYLGPTLVCAFIGGFLALALLIVPFFGFGGWNSFVASFGAAAVFGGAPAVVVRFIVGRYLRLM